MLEWFVLNLKCQKVKDCFLLCVYIVSEVFFQYSAVQICVGVARQRGTRALWFTITIGIVY